MWDIKDRKKSEQEDTRGYKRSSRLAGGVVECLFTKSNIIMKAQLN